MRIRENLRISELAGEKLVILENDQQVDFKEAMVLNKTSEWLWSELINRDFDEEEVANLLYCKYDIDGEIAKADAIRWIEVLKSHHVLVEN